MNIFRARPPDAPALAELEQKQPFCAQWKEAGFASELKNAAAVIWCAREDEKIVGFAALREAAGFCEILNAGTDPAYCRRGYAFKLLSCALTDLRARGAQHVTLEVNCTNHAAIALYTKLGFTAAGRRKNFYHGTEDALIMGTDL